MIHVLPPTEENKAKCRNEYTMSIYEIPPIQRSREKGIQHLKNTKQSQ